MQQDLIVDAGSIDYNGEMRPRFLFPFNQLNFLTLGGILDRITVIQSRTNEGKSSLSSQILCECIKQGFKCFADFGEDDAEDAVIRLYKQFTPYDKNNYVSRQYIVNGKGTPIWEYSLTEEKFKEAQEFFKGKLYLYNIMISPNIDNIILALDKARNNGCQIGLIDNLENLEYEGDNENKNFKDIAIALRNYAVKYNMHIILVAHTRKTDRDVLLPSIDDIKGSSAVANCAKNVICIVRTDTMDKTSTAYKNLAKLVEMNNYDLNTADGLIVVQKTKGRKLGMFTVGFSKQTNSYYECKKIDINKEEPDAPIMNIPEGQQIQNQIEEIDAELFDLPF